MYFCEAVSDRKIIIHRGGKTGPVIATGSVCSDKEGTTEVQSQDDVSMITLEHVHHDLLHTHGKTSFTYNGKRYHWKGHTGLVDDETNTLLAIFHSSWFGLNWTKIGRLEITVDGQKMTDVVVVTALIVQERSDEEKQSVIGHKCLLMLLAGTRSERSCEGWCSILFSLIDIVCAIYMYPFFASFQTFGI